jgi:hypothetical protein
MRLETAAMEDIAAGRIPELEPFVLTEMDSVEGVPASARGFTWSYVDTGKSGKIEGPSRHGAVLRWVDGRLELEAVAQGYDAGAVREAVATGARALVQRLESRTEPEN